MVRFPKLAMSDTARVTGGGMNTSSNQVVPGKHLFQNNAGLQVAPSRYSNVRKVIFSLTTGKFGNGTTSTCQLGVDVGSTTTPALTVQQFNLPVSTIISGASDYGFTPTNRIDAGVNGPTTTIIQKVHTAGERDHAQMLQVEFDREDAAATTFFGAWDAFDDDDDYILLQPFVDSLTADTGSVIAYAFKNFQCTIIQEENSPNDSSTDWHSYIGCRDALEATTTFQGNTFGPRMPFHFVAADWDGLSGISVIFYGTETSSSTQLTVRVHDITDVSDVFSENFSLPSGGISFYVARTQDFLSSLIDGHDYFIDYLLDAANSGSDPRGTGYFTLIQKGFTKTVTFHQLSQLSFTPATVDETDSGAVLFDPAWYNDSPPTIRESKVVSAFAHNDATNTADQSLRVDTDLQADDSERASGTAVDLTPNHTFTSTPTGPKSLFTDILTNDPMEETVQVRLQKSFPAAGSWLAGTQDFPGHMGLYYAFEVPDESPTLSQFGHRGDDLANDIGPI